MEKSLLILGAGQYGMVARETAQAMGCFSHIDFLDDRSELAIGKLTDCEKFAGIYRYAFVAIGDSKLRLQLIQKLEEFCYTVTVLVHPQAILSSSAQLYKGTILEPMSVVQANSTIAVGSIISSGAVVAHNSFVGDGCHIDCNAVVPSGSVVPDCTKIACGQVYARVP